jgi:hypothetical protein
VSNNLSLTHLAAGGNQLATLDLGNYSHLHVLDVNRNRLETLDVSNSPLLEQLDVRWNQLESTADVIPSPGVEFPWEQEFLWYDDDFEVWRNHTPFRFSPQRLPFFTVTFMDGDTPPVEQRVEQGGRAIAPPNPTRDGYNFIGWDTDFSNVTSDLIVNALYERVAQAIVRPVPTVFRAPPVRLRPTEASFTWTRIPGAGGYQVWIPGVGFFDSVENKPEDPNNTQNNPVTFRVQDLRVNTAYNAMVRTYWIEGWDRSYSNFSDAISFATTGPAPTNIQGTASTTGPTTATVTWNPVTDDSVPPGTIGYTIFRDGVRVGTSTGTSFTDDTLRPGVAVRYTVRAYWGTDESNAGSISAQSPTVTPLNPIPTGVKVIEETPTGFTVEWNAITGAALVRYNVYVNGVLAGTPTGTRLASGDFLPAVQIAPANTYSVQVAGVWTTSGGDREGRLSTAVIVRTGGPAPQNLKANDLTATSVKLTWDLVVEAAGYIIYRDGEEIGTSTTASFPDNDLRPGVTVRYTVRAYWGTTDMFGSASAVLTVNPPGVVPQNVRNDNRSTPLSFAVRWNAITSGPQNRNLDDFLGYNVYVDGEVAAFVECRGRSTHAISTSDTAADIEFCVNFLAAIAPNTAYAVQVAGVWEASPEPREGGLSNTAIISTTGPAPRNLKGSSPTPTSAELTWDDPSGSNLNIQGWRINKDGEPVALVSQHGTMKWNDNEAIPGVQARYTVQAVWDLSGDFGSKPGSVSGAVTVTPTGTAPTGIKTTVTPSTVSVTTWIGVDAPGYKVYLLLRNGTVVETEDVTGIREVEFTRLTPNTQYQVRVAPVWSGGEGRLSSAVNARTTNPAPTGLTRSDLTPTSVVLRWNDPAGSGTENNLNIQGWRISKNGAHHIDLLYDSVTEEGRTEWTDVTLTPGSAVRYTIQPLYVWGGTSPTGSNPGAAATVSVTPPNPAPANLARRDLTNSNVTLAWNLASNVNNDLVNAFLIVKTVDGVAEQIRVSRESVHFEGAAHRWEDQNLRPGVQVRYQVHSLWDAEINGEFVTGGKPGRVASLTVSPPGGAAPGGLKTRVVSPTQVSVTWNAISGAANTENLAGYNVHLYLNGVRLRSRMRIPLEASRSVTFEELNPNTRYQVRVEGVWDFKDENNVVISSRVGRQASANVNTTGPAPGNLRIVANSRTGTSVSLTWNAVTQPGVVGYRVMRTENDPLVPARDRVAMVAADVTVTDYINNGNGWTDDGLRPGIPVSYTVQALWNVDSTDSPGTASKRINVTPLGSAPGGVRAVVNNPAQVTVTWNAVSNVAGAEVSGYRVRIFTPATRTVSEVTIDEVIVPAVQRIAVFGIEPGTQYRVSVTALWNGVWNDDELENAIVGRTSSNINTRSTGPAPTGLRAQNVWTTSVQLTWNTVPGAAGYRINRTVGGETIPVVDIKANEFTWVYAYTDTGLTPGVQVRYTVQALWSWESDTPPMGSRPGAASKPLTVTPIRT